MKIKKEIRSIEVPVVEIDMEHVLKFLNEAYDFEDTIGKDGNYTSEYLYFETFNEKVLEPILLKHDVIRRPEHFKDWNDKVDEHKHDKIKQGYYDCIRYWLSDGYYKFRDDFFRKYNEI